MTYAHIDHVGGALALKRATGASILLHQADLSLLRTMEMQAAWLGVAAPPVQPPDTSVEDGLVVGLPGLAGQVLHAPGHTEGSISILFGSVGLLFSGCTLFAGSIGRTDLPGGDGRRILCSIHERMLPLPGNTLVIPGHGAETTIGLEREQNDSCRFNECKALRNCCNRSRDLV